MEIPFFFALFWDENICAWAHTPKFECRKKRNGERWEKPHIWQTAFLKKGDANGEETKFDKNSVGEQKWQKPHSTNRQKPHEKNVWGKPHTL